MVGEEAPAQRRCHLIDLAPFCILSIPPPSRIWAKCQEAPEQVPTNHYSCSHLAPPHSRRLLERRRLLSAAGRAGDFGRDSGFRGAAVSLWLQVPVGEGEMRASLARRRPERAAEPFWRLAEGRARAPARPPAEA